MWEFVQILLKGFSQVFFQDRVVMGALVALGLGIASPIALALALLGAVVSIVVANMLGIDANLYREGVTAFSGILIGCVASFYCKSLPTSVLVVIVGAALGSLVFYALVKHHITPFAVPFVIVTFLIVIAVNVFGLR